MTTDNSHANSGKERKQSLAEGSLVGEYKIIRLLGCGGMGEVYEAEHLTLRKRYALKFLPVDFEATPGAVERFKREAKVMANLEHPNIIKVDDFGNDNGRYWIRMELVHGVEDAGKSTVSLADLEDLCAGTIEQFHFAQILRQILEAMAYAHSQGVVHRDLKPGNILLDKVQNGKDESKSSKHGTALPASPVELQVGGQQLASDDYIVKVSDFGLVRLVGEERVRSQAEDSVKLTMPRVGTTIEFSDSNNPGAKSLIGTYEYMSPEQKKGKEAGKASDVYAIGLICYRLLTGKQLGPRPPSYYVKDLFDGLDELILKALEERPAERFADASEMLSAFSPIYRRLAKIEHLNRGEKALRKKADEERRKLDEAERKLREDTIEKTGGRTEVSQNGSGNAPFTGKKDRQVDNFLEGSAIPLVAGYFHRSSGKILKLAAALIIVAALAVAAIALLMTWRSIENKESEEVVIQDQDSTPDPHRDKDEELKKGDEIKSTEAVRSWGSIKPKVQSLLSDAKNSTYDAPTRCEVAKSALYLLNGIRYSYYLPSAEKLEVDKLKTEINSIKSNIEKEIDSLKAEPKTDGRASDDKVADTSKNKPPRFEDPKGMVAYYPFNGNANDESGNGNNGTVHGATLATDRFEKANSAYRFNGRNKDYIEILSDASLPSGKNPRTITMWIYPYSVVEGTRLLSYGQWSQGNAFDVDFAQGSSSGRILGVVTHSYNSGTKTLVEPLKWKFVSITFSKDSIDFYFDGKLQDRISNLNLNTVSSGAWRIGGPLLDRDTKECCDGIMDDIRIYNRALTEDEIKNLYKMEAPPEAKAEPKTSKSETKVEEASKQTDKGKVPAGFEIIKGPTADTNGWASEIKHAKTRIEMVYVAPGKFMMGSPPDEKGRSGNETLHNVNLTKPYYIGKYEVTKEQWEKEMRKNSLYFKEAGLPVGMVSWDDCQSFCKRIGNGFRLPTEAEWEYACRGGNKSKGYKIYSGSNNLDEVGWYDKNSGNKTHLVGQKKPNELGLCDMSGNVWEWCSDWHGGYPAGTVQDPIGAPSGSYRILRGGSPAGEGVLYCRAAFRHGLAPTFKDGNVGLRLAFDIPFDNQSSKVELAEPGSKSKTVGKWAWCDGAVVELKVNGTGTYSGKTILTGTWEDKDGTTIVKWSNGFTDTLTFLADGKKADAVNQAGNKFSVSKMK